jgi:hypothetical protein
MTQEENIKEMLGIVTEFKNEKGNIKISEKFLASLINLSFTRGEMNSLKKLRAQHFTP